MIANDRPYLNLVACLIHLMGVLLILAVVGLPTVGEEKRRLFCEGEYSRLSHTGAGHPKEVKLDDWQLYHMVDGRYSLEVKNVGPQNGSEVYEHRLLSEKLKPISFGMEVLDRGQPQAVRVKIECQFGAARVDCSLDDIASGVAISDTIGQKTPYGFLPVVGPFPLDLAWYYQMLLAQVDRVKGTKVLIPVVGFTEGENKNSLKLVAQSDDEIEYCGLETIDRLNQKIVAYKFRLLSTSSPNDPESVRFAWLSQSGLLIQVANKDGLFLILSAYHGPQL
jgi:hypothetical protein